MRRQYPLVLLLLLLFGMNGCVSVPENQQLVMMDTAAGLYRAQADCVVNSTARNIKVATQSDHVIDADNISILNWNIYKGQRNNWGEDFSRLIQQQDILLVQEALLNQEIKSLLDQQQFNWNMNAAFYLDDMEAGVLTASKVSPLRSCGMRMQEPLIRIPKSALPG